MRILYCALDQRVPGTLGGSVHVRAVAEGLAALGHEVHAITGSGDGPRPQGPVHWHTMRPPAGRSQLRLLRARAVRRLARAIRPDVVIERYHNFGGEGALAANGHRRAIRARGQRARHRLPRLAQGRARPRAHRAADAALARLAGEPGRSDRHAKRDDPARRRAGRSRARDRMGRGHDALPSRRDRRRALAPRSVRASWRCSRAPSARGMAPFSSSRPSRGCTRRATRSISAVLIGEGPERGAAERAARGVRGITFAGRVAHTDMPSALAAADIGVAPFDVSQHPPLALAFYWSPLKVFEYMASGLPVVAPGLPRLRGTRRGRRRGRALRACDAGRSCRGHGDACRSSQPRADGPAPRAPGPCATTAGTRTAARSTPPSGRGYNCCRPCACSSRPIRSLPTAAAAAGARTSWSADCARADTRSTSCGRGRASPASGRRGLRRVHDPRVRRDRAADSVRAQLLQERAALDAGSSAISYCAARGRSATTSCTRSTC